MRNRKKERIIIWLILIISIIVSMSSCKTKTLVVHDMITDTLTVHTHDTVTVHDRVVQVSVPLPQTNLQDVTHDTLSVLTDGLYKSIAKVKNGILFHFLSTIPGAKIDAPVTVHDTITKHYSDTVNKSNQIKTITKYVKQPLSKWQSFIMDLGYFLFTLLLVAVVGGTFYLCKKFNIPSIIMSFIKKLIIHG